MTPEEFKTMVDEMWGPDGQAAEHTTGAPEAFVFCAGCGSRMAIAALEDGHCAACRQSEQRRRATGGAPKTDPDEALAYFTAELEEGEPSVDEDDGRTASRTDDCPRAEMAQDRGQLAEMMLDTPAPENVPVAPSSEAAGVSATGDLDEIIECRRCHGRLSRLATVDGYCLVCYEMLQSHPLAAADVQTSQPAAGDVLLDAVRLVAELRERAAAARATVQNAKLIWEAAHATEIEAEKAAKASLEVAEAALRTAAEIEFLVSGDKQPAPGVAIRMLTVIEYEAAAALAWCIDHQQFLSFDRKNFEAFAKKFPDQVLFVESSEEPQIMLAVDLQSALEAQR